MNTVAFLLRHAVFTTKQFAVLREYCLDFACIQLMRMARQGAMVRLSRGI